MSKSKMGFPEIIERSAPLQVGFIPVSDCAPLIVARESGLFDKYELNVELRRETAWANIRDRVICGELDAAQAPATLPFITNLGVESDRCACLTGLVLSLQGNAITISRALWNEGVRDAGTLRELIYRDWGKRTYTFGVVFPYSSQYILLRQWLRQGGILPQTEVRLVVLPPTQMFPTLKLGYIDGYCVGEPWTSLAIEANAGVCVATSGDLAPLHPEKVLMVRRDFAEERADEHERLIAALLEACAFCDQPKNRPLLAEMLSQPHYVNAPPECFKTSRLRPTDIGVAEAATVEGLGIFHHHNANDPTDDKAEWLVGRLYELMEYSVLQPPPSGRTPIVKNIFRRDIFQRARAALFDQNRALQVEAERYQTKKFG
jgi:ABC-type nitrate/sulfonate/bicarbonate transport system substrate-binding protein